MPFCFFFQAEDGIRDLTVTGVQTCALPILATEDMISAMCELLLPQTTILTPNSREARRLVQGDGEDDDELALSGAAEKLLGLGCEYVLITGTHENTPQVVNTLYGPEGVVRSDSWERLPGSYHG